MSEPSILKKGEKGKVIPVQALRVPGTGHLYHHPPENIPGIHSVRGQIDPRAIVQPEGLCQ